MFFKKLKHKDNMSQTSQSDGRHFWLHYEKRSTEICGNNGTDLCKQRWKRNQEKILGSLSTWHGNRDGKDNERRFLEACYYMAGEVDKTKREDS